MCPYIAIYSYQKGRLPSALTVCPYIAIYKTDTSFLHRSALPTGAPEQTHGPAPRGYGFGERVFDALHLESYFIGFQEKRALEVRQTEFPGRRGEYQVRICISQIRHTYVCRLSARSYVGHAALQDVNHFRFTATSRFSANSRCRPRGTRTRGTNSKPARSSRKTAWSSWRSWRPRSTRACARFRSFRWGATVWRTCAWRGRGRWVY